MPNPFQSPRTSAETPVKRRGTPWIKGLAAGFGSWFLGWAVIVFLAQTVLGGYPRQVETVATYVIMPLAVPFVWSGVKDFSENFEYVSLLSGILLHAAFWTVVFTVWRRWTG